MGDDIVSYTCVFISKSSLAFHSNCYHSFTDKMAPVAQLDACLTGDQEVAGSTLAGLATFFCGD